MASCSRSDPGLSRARISLLAFLCVLAFGAGCRSPLDPDTPRRRIVNDVVPPADTTPYHTWLHAEITFSGSNSGTSWLHKKDSAWAFVDTSHGKPELRFMFAATKLTPYLTTEKFLHAFLLADTLVADGIAKTLNKPPSTGTGALFHIVYARDSANVTPVETVVSGDTASGTISTLTLSRPNKDRIVRGTFSTYMQKYQMSLNGTVVINW